MSFTKCFSPLPICALGCKLVAVWVGKKEDSNRFESSRKMEVLEGFDVFVEVHASLCASTGGSAKSPRAPDFAGFGGRCWSSCSCTTGGPGAEGIARMRRTSVLPLTRACTRRWS